MRLKRWLQAQGIGSYTAIQMAIIIVVVCIVILLVREFLVTSLVTGRCSDDFDCRDLHIQQCIKTERYTRAECIQINSAPESP